MFFIFNLHYVKYFIISSKKAAINILEIIFLRLYNVKLLQIFGLLIKENEYLEKLVVGLCRSII